MAMRENHTNRFFTNMKFLWKYIFDTILYKVSMVCTKIRMQSLPKWQKYKYQTLSCQIILKCFFVFPEHCPFCLCKVLTPCHRYGKYSNKLLIVIGCHI